jgi:hypothetical protein
MDDNPAVASGVDIELHTIGVQHDCTPKGGS